jgi:hypothetical protein
MKGGARVLAPTNWYGALQQGQIPPHRGTARHARAPWSAPMHRRRVLPPVQRQVSTCPPAPPTSAHLNLRHRVVFQLVLICPGCVQAEALARGGTPGSACGAEYIEQCRSGKKGAVRRHMPAGPVLAALGQGCQHHASRCSAVDWGAAAPSPARCSAEALLMGVTCGGGGAGGPGGARHSCESFP